VKKTMIVLLIVATVLTTACSKKKDEPTLAGVEGYWVGIYNSTGGSEDNLSMLFKPGGVLRVYELNGTADTSALLAGSKATGEWSRVGNSILTSYKSGPATITTSKVLNAANTQMTGNWSSNGIAKGFIELNKQ
jgi:hypothetical protein